VLTDVADTDDLLRRSEALVFVDDLEQPVLAPDDDHHLTDVLRLRQGDVVVASDGRGSFRLCRFVPGSRDRNNRGGRRAATAPASTSLEVDGPTVRRLAPEPQLTVGFALMKGDRPELTVQKLTELGIDRIVPLLTDRTVVRVHGDDASRRGERLRRVAREAAAQSRRLFLPAVLDPVPIRQFVESSAATPVLAEPGAGSLPLGTCCILVGPEGGWTDTELSAATATVGLGTGILRAETAAIVAGALLSMLRAGAVSPPTQGTPGRSDG